MLLSYVLAESFPTAKFHFSSENETYDTLIWEDVVIEKPSKDDVQKLYNDLLVDYENRETQMKRYHEYPDLREFADAMYWASKGDNTKLNAYYAKCEAIKNKYPKA